MAKCNQDNKKALFECEECGTLYCNDCAENEDYQCDCQEPPKLILITQSAVKK